MKEKKVKPNRMIQNTTRTMGQIMSALSEVGGDWNQMDLSRCERAHIDRLSWLCSEYLKAHENYTPNALDSDEDDEDDEDE